MNGYALDTGQIFLLFFIMLGPLRLIEPFAQSTQGMETKKRQILGLKAGLLAFLSLVLSGFIGSKILLKWHISPEVMMLSGGIIFCLVAIRPLIPRKSNGTEKPLLITSPSILALHTLITPYGMAAVIVLFSMGHDPSRLMTIVFCLGIITLMNILVMIFTKPSIGSEKPIILRIFQSILATMQFALAIQIIVRSLKLIF